MEKTKVTVKKDAEIIQQNSTPELVVFKPTKSMLKWLQSVEKLGPTASITDISEDCEVDRSNWYKWIENKQFVEWWDQAWKKYLKLQRHKLDLIGLKKAQTDHDWWRDMKKVVGEPVPADPSAPVVPIQVNNQINVDKYMEEVPDAKNQL